MADLTTPNKPRRGCVWPASSTDGESNSLIALSPFLSLSSPYYLSVSPFRTVNISYVSPIHVSRSQPPLEDLLINICEKLNRDQPKPSASPFVPSKESCGTAKKATTPARTAEADTTSEGSDVKSSKTSARTSKCHLEKERDTPDQTASKEFKAEVQEKLKSARAEKIIEERVIRKRKRKSMDQLKLLAEEYRRNPSWNKGTMSEVARRTGLTEAQVYKWGWDQKKKKLEDSI